MLWRRVLSLVGENLMSLSAAAGITSSALLAFDAQKVSGVVVSVLAVLLLFGAIYRGFRQRKGRATALWNLTQRLEQTVDVGMVLRSIAERMELPSPWRIGIYEIQDGCWIRLARRSNFPQYEQSVGREKIPSDQGCLGWALKFNGKDELPALPDPEADLNGYVQIQAGRNISQQAATAMTMRSRSYAAVVYSIPSGPHAGVDVGIVVECHEPNGTSQLRLARTVSVDTAVLLHRLIKLGPEMVLASSVLLEV